MKKFKKKRANSRRNSNHKAKSTSKLVSEPQLSVVSFDDEGNPKSADTAGVDGGAARPDAAALLEVLRNPMVTSRKFDSDPRPTMAELRDKANQPNNADFGTNINSSDLPNDVRSSMLQKAMNNRSFSALEDSGNKTCEEYEKELENYQFMTMNEALEQVDETMSKPLLGPLMHQGDVVGLVAESNVGKTIFAMQLAEYWASGKFEIEGLQNEAGPQKVCFMSAEMSDTQMKRRYSSEKGGVYRFSDNLIYVDKNLDNEEKVKAMVKMVVKKAQPNIIIIDSLCQVADSDMTKMTQVKPLIKYFKEIAKENSVTFLIILHTKKRSAVDRKKDKMDKYSLYGSSAITNMFDSLWALDQALREPVRILTQVKSRDGDLVYNNDNALIMSVVKDEPDNFLRFELERVAAIGNLLTERKSSEMDTQVERQKAIVEKCYKDGVIREPSILRKYFGLTAGSSCRWITSMRNGIPLEYDYMLNDKDLAAIERAEREVQQMRLDRAQQLRIFNP